MSLNCLLKRVVGIANKRNIRRFSSYENVGEHFASLSPYKITDSVLLI